MAAAIINKTCKCHLSKYLSRTLFARNTQCCKVLLGNAQPFNNDTTTCSASFSEHSRTFSTLTRGTLFSTTPNLVKFTGSRNFFKDAAKKVIDGAELFKTLASLDTDLSSEQKAKFTAIAQHLFKSGDTSLDKVKELCADITLDDMYKLSTRMYSLKIHIGDEALTLALPIFKVAAAQGHHNSMYTCAQLLLLGTPGIAPDPVEAAKLFTELAAEGHGLGQFALGGMYYSGRGVEQNFKRAFSLYEFSTVNGVVQGYNRMGRLCLEGKGVEKDETKAVEYFTKGADAGDHSACMSLAYCYTHSRGVEYDLTKVFSYHLKAAELGHPPAIFNVGANYLNGQGVEQDYKQAAKYFEKAAEHGMPHAKVNLGNMYFAGMGVRKDWAKARELFQEASAKIPDAVHFLEDLDRAEAKASDEPIPV